MRSPTPKQRRQELIEQYVFSRRTMMGLMALACTPGLETLLDKETEPSRPQPPDNPTIPTLPQKDSRATQQQRQMQLQQTREEYQLGLRLPNSPRVETLPEREAFSEGYNNNRVILSEKIGANQQAFLDNPKPFQSLDDYAALFPVLPLPDIAQDFRSDDVFAQQRLSGPNSMELRNVLTLDYNLRDKLAITDEIFQAVLSKTKGRKRIHQTLDRAIREGGLFVTDYEVLDSVQPQENKYLSAPIALYFAQRTRGDFQLIPIAIQLGQVPGESLLCTPLDGVDWTLAKLIAQMADFYVNQLYRHLGQTHLVMEPIALATSRSLSDRHPVNVFLKPHFEFTMAVNSLADEGLINPGGAIDVILAGTLESSLQLTNTAVSDFFNNFSDFALPTYLRQRGVDNSYILGDFPYRDDGLLVWNTLEDYVSRYIGIYYKSDRDIREDFELQNWLQALRKPVSDGGFGVVSLPASLTNRDQLIDILTIIMFTAGPQHSAIAWIQYQYMAFIPNMPGALYQPVPTSKGKFPDENSLTSFLPSVQPSLTQIQVMSIVGTKRDPKAFTDFGTNSFQDPQAIRVLISLQNRLEVVEKRIEQRNKRRKECYSAFLPSRMSNGVSG
ncbi:lipoxygenase family protein [Rivularia sp. UHCC 0363]|uniref:lipoxygenase family protein n=1 Tax=Rivularia sp. UHCC 0363 TaxID=3110244 RepID=UPI002B215E6C|nr:lipoxygenase family protein [Rivularia sp. UHCC 0363]MEA5596155.1 lipoxygenase family protein [Rivularia sp. UHCC 0363]